MNSERRMSMVTTVCYRKKEVWNTRKEAMDFFFEAMCATMGSAESLRYETIYCQLATGKNFATDEED